MWRTFLLILAVVAVILLAGFLFYIYANKHAPSGLILKILGPAFVALIWIATAILDHNRTTEEQVGGLIITRTDLHPFLLPLEQGETSSSIQHLAPWPIHGKEPSRSNYIYGTILCWLANVTGPDWRFDATVASSPYSTTTFRIEQGTGREEFDLAHRLEEVDLVSDHRLAVGLPEGASISRPQETQIILDLKTQTLLLDFGSHGSISLGSSPRNKMYQEGYDRIAHTSTGKLFDVAEGTEQPGPNQQIAFRCSVKREVDWKSQWSELAKEEMEYTDRILSRLSKDVAFSGYEDFFAVPLTDSINPFGIDGR